MHEFVRLFQEHADLTIVYFHVPHVLAEIERRKRGGRIGNWRLSLAIDPILRTPNQNTTAETTQENNNTRPV